jgi:hypothetical protein
MGRGWAIDGIVPFIMALNQAPYFRWQAGLLPRAHLATEFRRNWSSGGFGNNSLKITERIKKKSLLNVVFVDFFRLTGKIYPYGQKELF